MTFTHLDAAGHARMVDVTEKQPTVRSATAHGFVRCAPTVVEALRDGTTPKGDVLAVARISGIQAAKRTPELLPLAPAQRQAAASEIDRDGFAADFAGKAAADVDGGDVSDGELDDACSGLESFGSFDFEGEFVAQAMNGPCAACEHGGEQRAACAG